MKRRWWRLGLRVIAHLGAGVVVAFAVAWGSVLLVGPHGEIQHDGVLRFTRHGGLWLEVFHERSWAADRFVSFTWRSARSDEAIPDNVMEISIPSWARSVLVDPGRDNGGGVFPCVEARGWPARMLFTEVEVEPPWRVRGGLETSLGWSRWHEAPRLVAIVFPLQPIASGVVVNAAAYGLGVYAFATLVNALRGRLRRRQQRCMSCGYDLRGSVGGICPECGK